MTGQPSTFNEAAATAICDRLAEGESLRAICESEGLPGRTTVYRWLEANDAFRAQYVRARELQADHFVDEIIAIADDGAHDIVIDDHGNERTDHDVVQRSKLRVDARKWIAAKLRPRVYGDKLTQEISGPDGGPIEVDDPRERIRSRLAGLRAARGAGQPPGEPDAPGSGSP